MDEYDVYSGSHRIRRGQRDLNHSGAVRPPRAGPGPQVPPPQLSEDENEGSGDDSSESRESNSRPRHGRFRRPVRTIDWRAELCRFLNIVIESTNDEILDNLEKASLKLEEAERITAEAAELHDLTPRYQVIHRVRCAADDELYLYLEEPFVVNSGPRNAHLRGSEAIHNFELYLERNKALSFIAYKDYRCCDDSRSRRRRYDRSGETDPSTLLTNESVSIISPDLCSALKDLAEEALSLFGIPHPAFEIENEFPSPYLWWFHGRQQIAVKKDFLDEYYQEHINIFQQYLQDRLGLKWDMVDKLLTQNKITAQFIEYLFVPNTILVAQSDNEKIGQQQAYLTNSWLQMTKLEGEWNQSAGRTRPQEFTGIIDGTCWTFDGNFQKKTTRLTLDGVPSMKEPFNIRDLSIYPIRFAEKGLEDALRARGLMYWKCRQRNYVCYSEEFNDGIQSTSDPRFMIDIATYKQMHPPDPKKPVPVMNQDDLGPEITSLENPPSTDDFLLCLPKTIPGFNMNKKEWTNLDVSRITPVIWNTEAFNSLVVDEETKELISALVTNQIDAEKATDLMSGKGNGLFILLHGGPGTGKTLTAESVAEFSKKPLYRVTCGDIGTEAGEVEKYLEVVMLLGKTWGCVVLLDEADVFLEQRKISDLQRNALVSVFLRVLEYYDGILILTSNRVGTFDEAFKSRIQLTLRYKNLEEKQRLKIWENFITRLESFQKSTIRRPTTRRAPSIHGGVDLGINAEEVRAKIKELAKTELNGREIRNAVSTARQLAMFRRQPMGYDHLRIVIAEAEKFENYLLELNKGFTRDQIMEDIGERLSYV